ncbi:hypothetical protein V1477_014491 [Vespula maculifrons]|uniref:Uncharacterized protein n=1 Tax=Vespula maculifrons TaxID=7453 RepID=A0ABD2BHY0_VESMC
MIAVSLTKEPYINIGQIKNVEKILYKSSIGFRFDAVLFRYLIGDINSDFDFIIIHNCLKNVPFCFLLISPVWVTPNSSNQCYSFCQQFCYQGYAREKVICHNMFLTLRFDVNQNSMLNLSGLFDMYYEIVAHQQSDSYGACSYFDYS